MDIIFYFLGASQKNFFLKAPQANYCTKLGLLRNGTEKERERERERAVPKLHLRLIPEVARSFREEACGKNGIRKRLLRKWQPTHSSVVIVHVEPRFASGRNIMG